MIDEYVRLLASRIAADLHPRGSAVTRVGPEGPGLVVGTDRHVVVVADEDSRAERVIVVGGNVGDGEVPERKDRLLGEEIVSRIDRRRWLRDQCRGRSDALARVGRPDAALPTPEPREVVARASKRR